MSCCGIFTKNFELEIILNFYDQKSFKFILDSLNIKLIFICHSKPSKYAFTCCQDIINKFFEAYARYDPPLKSHKNLFTHFSHSFSDALELENSFFVK